MNEEKTTSAVKKRENEGHGPVELQHSSELIEQPGSSTGDAKSDKGCAGTKPLLMPSHEFLMSALINYALCSGFRRFEYRLGS